MVARSPDAPVADTVTSCCLAWSIVLILLMCQVAHTVCCLAMLPTDSNLSGSKRATGLP